MSEAAVAKIEPDFTEEVLFQSDDLIVRRVARGQGALCYVTFDSFSDRQTLARPGFGEGFFRSRGIDAIHVVSRGNDWYQYDELPEALAAIAAATQGYGQVIAYGSSMGGFAALRYGSACGATIGLALSPQFSVDPAVVPFEDRWTGDAAGIVFRDDEGLAPLPRQYVLYDPRDRQDARHFALFARRSPTMGIEIPYGGHPVGGYLGEVGLFQALFDSLHDGTLDAAAFSAELRRRRRQSAHYLFTLALRAPLHRRQQKLALAQMACAAGNDHPIYLSYLGHALDLNRRFDEAREVHARAIAKSPGTLAPLHNLLLHYERRGDLRAAARLADSLMLKHGHVSMVRDSHRRIRLRRRHATPLGWIARQLRLDPLVDRVQARLERLREPIAA